MEICLPVMLHQILKQLEAKASVQVWRARGFRIVAIRESVSCPVPTAGIRAAEPPLASAGRSFGYSQTKFPDESALHLRCYHIMTAMPYPTICWGVWAALVCQSVPINFALERLLQIQISAMLSRKYFNCSQGFESLHYSYLFNPRITLSNLLSYSNFPIGCIQPDLL